MQAIVELASRLGKAIAESPQAAKLRSCRQELNKHKDLLQLLSDYSAQADRIAKCEQEGKPIEVEDKHKLVDIQSKLVSSEVFKAFTAAQVDYIDMMRKVNSELRKCLAETEK